jgi:putative PIN family toxin of toxin-antitoxin system
VRFVLDTSVLVAAIRSRLGASNLLVEAVLAGRLKPLLSVALVLEYEAVLKRPEQLLASGLSGSQVDVLLSAICATGSEVKSFFDWRPQLRDANDEMVLEAAINGQANAIVTHNRRDFVVAAESFGIDVVSPAEALERMGLI